MWRGGEKWPLQVVREVVHHADMEEQKKQEYIVFDRSMPAYLLQNIVVSGGKIIPRNRQLCGSVFLLLKGYEG